ncbi:hypothetical protein HYDPIDRAFT_44899, partial [Hydnomerulius pinastri MD-312]
MRDAEEESSDFEDQKIAILLLARAHGLISQSALDSHQRFVAAILVGHIHRALRFVNMPSCLHCPGRSFVNKNALRRHNDAKHTFYCHYCDKGFRTSQGQEQYEHEKHPTYECRHCYKQLNSPGGRRKHEEAKHGVFQCRSCRRKFNSAYERDNHVDEPSHYTYTSSSSSSQVVWQPMVSNPVTSLPAHTSTTPLSSAPTADLGTTEQASTSSAQSQCEDDEADHTLDVAESHPPENENRRVFDTSIDNLDRCK